MSDDTVVCGKCGGNVLVATWQGQVQGQCTQCHQRFYTMIAQGSDAELASVVRDHLLNRLEKDARHSANPTYRFLAGTGVGVQVRGQTEPELVARLLDALLCEAPVL